MWVATTSLFVEEAAWRALVSKGETQFMSRSAWASIFARNAVPNPMGVSHVYISWPVATDAVAAAYMIERNLMHIKEAA